MDVDPLILTLRMDADSSELFERLRREHFPPERNFIPAHLTLFHHLPGDDEGSISETLSETSGRITAFPLHFPKWRFLGRGVAIEAESPQLRELRSYLGRQWSNELTAQDRQKFRPHITIQNKVEPQAARDLFEDLNASHKPFYGSAIGLMLWRYLGGPWSLAREFAFRR